MTSEQRKRWWQAAAVAVLGGGAFAGWYGYKSATAQPAPAAVAVPMAPPAPYYAAAFRQPVAEPPRVQEVMRNDPAVAPASAALPVLPAIPSAPLVPAAPPALPALPPAPIEPVTGPRAPDAGLLPLDKKDLPKLPEPPALPAPPKPLDLVPPVAPPVVPPSAEPSVPPLPLATEPPRAAPIAPPAPLAPPVQPVDPVQIAPPAKPESGLNAPKIGNTLNSMVAPLAPPPAQPAAPPPAPPPTAGREVPGKTVERAKVPETVYGHSDKYAFPLPGARPVPEPTPQPSIDTMLNTTRTSVALLGGALLAAEASAVPALPPVKPPAVPAVPVRADDPDVKKLKDDLTEANKKIAALEKELEKLRELVLGKKDKDGYRIESDPGAVEEIKRLKNTIDALTKELTALKTQTVQKPNVPPEPPKPLPDAKPRGTVKVVNEYPVEISMVINEKSYRVAPNTKVEVEVPAGEFTYQLLQAGVAATRSAIKYKETVTLRIK